MYYVEHCWESRSGGSVSGVHTVIFETEGKAKEWLDQTAYIEQLLIVGEGPYETEMDKLRRLLKIPTQATDAL